MPGCILRRLDLAPVISETLKEIIEPHGDIATPFFHEVHFLVGNNQLLKHSNLVIKLGSEPRRIHSAVPVDKFIPHLRPWEIINHGTAHSEFIQVIVSEIIYQSAHTTIILKEYGKPKVTPTASYQQMSTFLYETTTPHILSESNKYLAFKSQPQAPTIRTILTAPSPYGRKPRRCAKILNFDTPSFIS